MKIIWTKLALSDLDAAYYYIFEAYSDAARSVIERVENILESLRQQPEMGRLGRVEGTRELVMPSLPFIILYRIKKKEIHILAFLHASRRWPETL
ncbi:MAG: type II toxin-antitoxin system RelE/ParE family toxin [bacterium]|nr:type II toxin-antitoxin system RelE/ParE family toxin [bacterium]